MNKSELATSVAAMTGMPQEAALRAVNAAINTITDAIGKGESVVLPGFGTFSRKHRNSRKGINPQTREAVDIPETYVPSFKPGKTLKEAAKGESQCSANSACDILRLLRKELMLFIFVLLILKNAYLRYVSTIAQCVISDISNL